MTTAEALAKYISPTPTKTNAPHVSALCRVLLELDARERSIVLARMPVQIGRREDWPPFDAPGYPSWDEVGRRHGITRERARQIFNKICWKIELALEQA